MFEIRTPARCGYKCACKAILAKKWVLDIKLGKAALEQDQVHSSPLKWLDT